MAANPVPISPPNLTINVQSTGNSVVLRCAGRLTSETSETLKSQVKKLLPDTKRIVVDLGGVEHMDSSGLGTLLATYVSARSAGCEFRLINLSQRVSDLLKLTKLSTVFEGYGEFL